jgi:hypothetical protein
LIMADDGVIQLRTTVDLTGTSALGSSIDNLSSKIDALSAHFEKLAQSSRSAGNSAKEGVEQVTHVSMEARHGVMMLGEEFGVRLPRAIAGFIASLGPVGAAMAAAFPILAIVALFDILSEKIISISEKPARIAEAWSKYDETVFSSGEHIRAEIDKEEQKLIEMTEGPIAGLQFALGHLQTTAFEVFKSITEDTTAAMAAMKEQDSFTNVFGPAREDLEKFREEVGAAMRAAATAHPEDSLAAYNAAIALVQQKERDLTALIAQRTAASGADASAAIDGIHAEREAVNEMLPLLQEGVELDKEKRAVAEQEVSDASTKAADRLAQAEAKSTQQGLDLEESARTKARQEYIANLEEGERLAIEATVKGTAGRLAAIDAAIKEEQAHGLQDEGFYRGLLSQRQQAVQEEAQAEVQARLKGIEDVAKLEETAAQQSERQALSNIAEQTKASQAAQAETYKQQTAQPFVAPAGKLTAAEQNASALLGIARDEATQEESITAESATKRIQALQSMIPQYTVAYAAGELSAKDYGDKVAAVERQVTEITQAEVTKRVQLVDKERDEETKIQEQLLATYLQVKTQEEAAITSFVASATSSLNQFAVTIATTIGEVNGKISESRYIGEQFSRLWIQLEREFLQMILKMIEDTTLFKSVESTISGVFEKAFSVIGLGPSKPPAQAGGIPGLQGGPPLVGGQIAGGAGGAQQSAANAALTEFTSSLHLASTALAQSHAATTADTSATQLNTGATHTDIAATQISTGATHTDTAATVVSTSSTATNTAAVTTSTAAHTFHTPTVLADAGGFITHEAAVIGDTIAMIAHKIAALFTGAQTGGLIQGPGTGTSDSIHMMVSSGEYIVRAAAVAQPGMLDTLHALNSGKVSGGKLTGHHAATGGYMDAAEYDNRVGSAFGDAGSFGGDHGGGGGGGSTQFNSESHFHLHQGNVSALDGEGLGSVLRRGDKHIASIARTAIARGQINVRQLLRGR